MKLGSFTLSLAFAMVAATHANAAPFTGIIQVGSGGVINAINTANGQVSRLYTDPQGRAFNAGAYDPDNGLVYFRNGTNLFSFDPTTPGDGITAIGTTSVGSANAGWFDGLYYAIENGNELAVYDLEAATGGALTPLSRTTMNLAGTGLTSLVGGDMDFIDGALVITALQGDSSALFKYDSVSDITAPPSQVTKGGTGRGGFSNGIAFDPGSGRLFGYNAVNARFYEINQDTLTPGMLIGNTNPAFQIAGDLTSAFTIPQTVPEPSSVLLLGAGLVGLGLIRRRKSARS